MKFEFAFTQLPYFLKPLSRLAVCVALFMSGFLLTPTSMVLADDTTGSGSSNSSSNGDGQQATVERSNGTALRAAVHNGVVKIINNTLQADVDLFFDALPVSKTRLASLASMAELPESFKFSIKNEDLGKADPTLWDFGIDSTTADRRKGLLKDALAMSSFDKAGLQNRQFLTKWTSFKGAYPNAIRNLASADYYGLLFDGSKLNILLSSTEARLAVRSERSDVKVAFFDAKGNEIKSAKGDLANGLILSEGIVWKITAFPQKVADVINPETKTPETLYYCRFGITATMPTLRITANKDAGQDVKL